MSSYLTRAASPLSTPQSEKIPSSTQVRNNTTGFAWKVGTMERLRRWLVLGSESPTLYVGQRDLTRQNIDGVREALDEHGVNAVEEIIAVSTEGRAPKNDEALYALAIACAHSDEATRKAAIAGIPKVARTGTHLFHFAEFVQTQRGWGRALKNGIAAWYEGDPEKLAYQLVKYRSRDGWSHRDLLRLSHPKAPTEAHAALYDWACGRPSVPNIEVVRGFHEAQDSPSPANTAAIISRYESLPREALQTEHLNAPEVWNALLKAGMPMTALIRNLATMTRIGVLKPMGDATKIVVEQLANEEAIKKARIHPIAVLGALVTYSSGQSARGSNSWEPLREIVDALDSAFYTAFGNVEPTGKRTMLALDVSGSMTYGDIAGMPGLTPRVASAAMALITAAVEPNYHIMAFSGGFIPLSISPRMRLDDVIKVVSNLPFDSTNCALPMLYASQSKMEIETFQIYTDNETNASWGSIHPAQALVNYRKESGIDAKLVVVGMTATEFSIADPNDALSLDCVGFDSSTPQVIADFSAGRI